MKLHQLSPLDASFLELEEFDESSHMHIGWAMRFDPLPGGGTPTLEQIRADLAERLCDLPDFRCRLSTPHTGGVSWPSWEPDPRFQVANHVRHATLPAPGGEPQLLDWLADFWSHRLDRSRPLWEITLLDGLAGGRWALVTKTHHALIDGVSGVDVSAALLDDRPTAAPTAPMPGANHDAPATPASEPGSPPHPARLVPGLAARGVRTGLDAVFHPTHLGRMLARSWEVAKVLVRDDLLGAPQTSLNVPIGGSRRYTVVRTELEDLKAIRTRLGGTVNDVVLALATAGLRKLLVERGEQPPEAGLRAMVPVNVRAAGEQLKLGNRVSSLFVDLPVAEPESLRRYMLVREAARARKSSPEARVSAATVELSGLAPPALHALAARVVMGTRLFNVTVTNVPGSPVPLYSHGAELREILPLVPIPAGHAIGIAVTSYAGTLVFGLNADRAAVPDLDVLERGMYEELAELRELADAGDQAGEFREASERARESAGTHP